MRIRFCGINYAYHEIESREGIWNSGTEAANLGHKPQAAEQHRRVRKQVALA
jgi:hypothetical protein